MKDNKRKPMDIPNNEFSEYDVPQVKEEKKMGKLEKISLFIEFLGAIYFAYNIYISATKLKDTPLYPYILGSAIAYIVIFFIFLIVHRNNSKQVKQDKKNFKSSVKFVKLVMNLLFILSSALIFIESLNQIDSLGFIATVNLIFSGVLLLFKFFSTISKIKKSIKKRKKQIEKKKNK